MRGEHQGETGGQSSDPSGETGGTSDESKGRDGHSDTITALVVADDALADRLDRSSSRIAAGTAPPARALCRVESGDVDCLVVEYDLPGTDGLSLLERIRERDRPVPVVMAPEDGSERIAAGAVSAGAAEYVPREDLDGPTLADAVESAVRERPAAGADLETYVRMVGHDLRNPLSVARGWLSLLTDGDEEHRERIEGALDRMEEILVDMRALAEPDADAGPQEVVELSAVATAAWELADAPGAELRVEYGPEVEANPGLFKQALENLFRNSAEHASTAGRTTGGPNDHCEPDVTVRVGALPDEDGLFVEDDGPGIPEGRRETVFDPGVSTREGGGFGLAVVREVVDVHGWSVDVTDSELGGTRFELTGVELTVPE